MIIEAGKFYKQRNGKRVGPIAHSHADTLRVFPWVAEDGAAWAENGDWSSMTKPHDRDLVAEWVGEPGVLDEHGTFAHFRYADDAPDMPKYREPEKMTKANLLDMAKAAVADRGLNYGKPEANFDRIAELWNAHLTNRGILRACAEPLMPKLTASDVAQMMVLMKIARLENDPSHLDSWVDAAGYAACGAEISA